MRRKRGARRLKISDKISDNQFMTCFYCFIRTYFKSEEAPLCRIEFQLITISHGDGISPKWKAVTSSVGKADTFPEREGSDLFRRQSRHLPRKGRFLPREINIISGKITEIFIRFKIVRIYIIILLFLLFLPFSIDLKPENMYNNIDITLQNGVYNLNGSRQNGYFRKADKRRKYGIRIHRKFQKNGLRNV